MSAYGSPARLTQLRLNAELRVARSRARATGAHADCAAPPPAGATAADASVDPEFATAASAIARGLFSVPSGTDVDWNPGQLAAAWSVYRGADLLYVSATGTGKLWAVVIGALARQSRERNAARSRSGDGMKGAMVVVVISPLIATARSQCMDINRRVAGTAHGCGDGTDLAVCTVSDGEFGDVGDARDRPTIPPLSAEGTRPLPNSYGAELLDKIKGGTRFVFTTAEAFCSGTHRAQSMLMALVHLMTGTPYRVHVNYDEAHYFDNAYRDDHRHVWLLLAMAERRVPTSKGGRNAGAGLTVIATTATFTPSSVAGLELTVGRPLPVLAGRLDRPNLVYVTILLPVDVRALAASVDMVAHLCHLARMGSVPGLSPYNPDSSARVVVYCTTQATTNALAAKINDSNPTTGLQSVVGRAVAYHAGLDPKQRRRLLEKFTEGSNRVQTLVTTSAALEGIDNPHVVAVVIPQVYATLNGTLQGWGRAGRWGKTDDRLAVVMAGFSAGVLKSMAPFTTTPRCVAQLVAVLRVLFLTPGCVRMAVLEEMGAAEDAQGIQVAGGGCCDRCSRCLAHTAGQFALTAPVDVTDEVVGLLRLVWAHGQRRLRPALGEVLSPTRPWSRNLAWVQSGRGVHATLAVAHCLVYGLLNIVADAGQGAGEDHTTKERHTTKKGARHCYRLWIDADDHPSGDPCVRDPRVQAIIAGLEVVRIWLR